MSPPFPLPRLQFGSLYLPIFSFFFPVRSLDPGYDTSGRRAASNLRISVILMTVKKGCGPRSFSGERIKDDIDV